MVTVTSLGFVALVWFTGFGTGWLARMSEEYMARKEDKE